MNSGYSIDLDCRRRVLTASNRPIEYKFINCALFTGADFDFEVVGGEGGDIPARIYRSIFSNFFLCFYDITNMNNELDGLVHSINREDKIV